MYSPGLLTVAAKQIKYRTYKLTLAQTTWRLLRAVTNGSLTHPVVKNLLKHPVARPQLRKGMGRRRHVTQDHGNSDVRGAV